MKKWLLFLLVLANISSGRALNGYCSEPFCCYLNFFGGANWADINGFDCQAKTKIGFMAGAGLGWQLGCCSRWLAYTRLEGEYAIRKNQLHSIKHNPEHPHGSVSTNSWMMDVYQDLPFSCYFTPYVGLGAGYSYRNALKEVELFCQTNDCKNGFAWQIIAGLSTPVNIATLLSLEYRYFTSPKDLYQQSVGLSLRYLY